MDYFLNCWYLVAWEEELAASGHLSRTVLEKPLLIVRGGDGKVSALLDRCPHRFAPLSRGRIDRDGVTCPYHGLRFDLQGNCKSNPHGPIVPSLCVTSFPIALKHAGVWVWFGEPEKADPLQIADLSIMASLPPTAQNFGYEHIEANYLLCADNILDLSHADSLHPDSLGGGATTRAKQQVKEMPGEIVVTWTADNDIAPPALAPFMPELDKPVNLHIELQWSAPSIMRIKFGAVLHEKPQLGGPDTWGIHVMTPLDATRTHYFYWVGRTMAQHDIEFNKAFREATRKAFASEDKPMLEAQQAAIGSNDFSSMRPVLMRTDEASVRMRRWMQRLIAEERNTKAA